MSPSTGRFVVFRPGRSRPAPMPCSFPCTPPSAASSCSARPTAWWCAGSLSPAPLPSRHRSAASPWTRTRCAGRRRCRRSASAARPTPLEHSLEVQLPFLQSVLDDFTLAPPLVGDASAQEVAEVIEPFPLPALRRSAAQGPGHRRPYPAAQPAGRIRAGLRRAACKRQDPSSAKTGPPAVFARPAQLRRHCL